MKRDKEQVIFMKNRLTKSKSNRMVSGVLGGISDYIGIDPTIVRVIYVVLTFCTTVFPGIVLYFVLAMIMPEGTRDSGGRGYDSSQTGGYYQSGGSKKAKRKEAEKVDERNTDDWSDF